MTTYDIKDFIPQLIEQNPKLLEELVLLTEASADVEIRIRDDMGVVYIIGLVLEEKGVKAELRRVKHKSYPFEAIPGSFPLNATLASALLSKQKETNTFIAEEEAYNDNLDF